MIERINIIGLPSGEVIEITKNQLDRLIREGLVIKVKRYKDMFFDEFCYDDSLRIKVMTSTFNQVIDELGLD